MPAVVDGWKRNLRRRMLPVSMHPHLNPSLPQQHSLLLPKPLPPRPLLPIFPHTLNILPLLAKPAQTIVQLAVLPCVDSHFFRVVVGFEALLPRAGEVVAGLLGESVEALIVEFVGRSVLWVAHCEIVECGGGFGKGLGGARRWDLG